MEFPGEKLLIKLWDTLVEKGIGSLLTPWQEARQGKVRTEIRQQEILMLAQAEADAAKIRSGEKALSADGTFKLVSPPDSNRQGTNNSDVRMEQPIDFATLTDTSIRAYIAEATRKEINASKAIIHAEEALADDPQDPPDRSIQDDWLFTWRDYAGRVSTQELQALWGKILAGETKSPGSYSLRTLEFLKGLSQDEAVRIAKLGCFVVEEVIIQKPNYLDRKGITFGFLLEMQELGIISGVDSIGLTIEWKSNNPSSFIHGLRSNNKMLVIEHSDPQKTLKMGAYFLTSLGKQIFGLGTFEPDVEYLKIVGKDISKWGFSVKLADWKQETEKMGRYFNAQEIEAQ